MSEDMVTVIDWFNSDRELVRQTVTFDVTNHLIADYCRDCSLPPDILRGEAVFLTPDGPVPYSLDWGRHRDDEIWGYIVSYDPETRRLEVAPKRVDVDLHCAVPGHDGIASLK